jgi:hypothetical protein
MLPTIPTDRPVYEGNIATYWFDDEILVSLSKSPRRTVELIKENVALVKKITNNKPVPLLIYLSDSPMPDKATRKFSSQMVPQIYSAMAMISKPGLSSFIMKMVFAMKKPPIPMKSFDNAEDAKQWLRKTT